MVLLKSKPATPALSNVMWPFMDNFFQDVDTTSSFFNPKSDILEKEKHFEIHLELPGMKKEEIKISLEDQKLIISGERKIQETEEKDRFLSREIHYGTFTRSYNIGKVDRNKIEAEFKDGILLITLPKSEQSLSTTVQIK